MTPRQHPVARRLRCASAARAVDVRRWAFANDIVVSGRGQIPSGEAGHLPALVGEEPRERAVCDAGAPTTRAVCRGDPPRLDVPGQEVGSSEPSWTDENLRVGCGLSKWKQAHIAAAMGGLPQVREDLDRPLCRRSEAGLVTRSSRPHSTPTRTSDEAERRVLVARAQHRDGPTFWLRRSGSRPARCVTDPLTVRDLLTGTARTSSRAPSRWAWTSGTRAVRGETSLRGPPPTARCSS